MIARLALAASGLALAGCGGGSLLPATATVGVAQVAKGTSLESARLRPDVCVGVDLAPKYTALDEHALVDFLQAGGYRARVARARADLVYVELQTGPTTGDRVRLRVALLPSSSQAGEELHRALLQHGTGWWGVHRSNLAVLAPRGTVERILDFAAKTRLACWGVLTVAGRDDAYVVPGGYREL